MKFKVGDIVLPTGKMVRNECKYLEDWMKESPLGIGRVVFAGVTIEGTGIYYLEDTLTHKRYRTYFYESELRLVE